MKIKDIESAMIEYFAKVCSDGIDGADYVNIAYIHHTEEDCGDSLYITFFDGDEQVEAYHAFMEDSHEEEV